MKLDKNVKSINPNIMLFFVENLVYKYLKTNWYRKKYGNTLLKKKKIVYFLPF